MNKKFIIGFVVVTIFFILIGLLPKINRTDYYLQRKKACVSNMRTCSGAVELYRMEKNTPLPLKDFMKTLIDNKYLPKALVCPGVPSGGQGVYEMFEAPGGYDFRCSVHGDLSKQEGEHKKMGAINPDFWKRDVFPDGNRFNVQFWELFVYFAIVVIMAAITIKQ